MFYSPLRYPWWKNKLAKFIAEICKDNNISGHYVEPYAWGSAVALFLLIHGYVKEITINDFDRSIYAFWYSVLHHTNRFIQMIEKADISIDNWYIQKDVQKNKKHASLLKLWFSTFFLNRTNISWIITAWVIWWINQNWKYKMDCRFNKKDLIKKIKLISQYKKKIHLYNHDALELIDIVEKNGETETVFYFDPPYYLKGQTLYHNAYKHEDHKKVSERIKNIKNAKRIVSYDNTKAIEDLYCSEKNIKYSFKHTAYQSRIWNEILFFSRNLIVDLYADPLMKSKRL